MIIWYTVKRIRFAGKKWVLVGNSAAPLDAAIATEQDFKQGKASFAHLYADGRIIRCGKQIGTREDIELLGDVRLRIDIDKFVEGFDDPAWLGPPDGGADAA